MEAEAALVRSEGGVELNAIAAVNLNITLVVLPGHAEHNSAFGLGDSFEDTVFLVLGIRLENRAESAKNFSDCLNEFRLIAVTMLEFFDDAIGVRHGGLPPGSRLKSYRMQICRPLNPPGSARHSRSASATCKTPGYCFPKRRLHGGGTSSWCGRPNSVRFLTHK